MQAGFAKLCAGSIRAKNAQNILLKNVMDACIGAIMWWATGYAFAYGETADQGHSKRFIGNDLFFLSNGFEGKDTFHSWFFQWAFAATAATIVSGAGPRHVQARRRRLRDRCARAASTLQCATESVPTNVPRVRSSSNSYSTPPPTRVRYISERSRESRRSRSIDPQLSAYSQDSKQKMDVEVGNHPTAKTA